MTKKEETEVNGYLALSVYDFIYALEDFPVYNAVLIGEFITNKNKTVLHEHKHLIAYINPIFFMLRRYYQPETLLSSAILKSFRSC